MIEPRPVEAQDRLGVLELLQDAFESPLEAKLVERLWASRALAAERLIDDGGVVAYAAVSEVSIGRLGSEIIFGEALGLAPVATSPRRRREGLGGAVVEAVIEAAFRAHPGRLMFVLGDAAYYRRFSFIPAAPLGYLWDGGDVGDAFQVLRHNRSAAPYAGAASDSGSRWPATVFYDDAFSVFSEGS